MIEVTEQLLHEEEWS